MAEINKIQRESIDPAKFNTKKVLDWRKLTSDNKSLPIMLKFFMICINVKSYQIIL